MTALFWLRLVRPRRRHTILIGAAAGLVLLGTFVQAAAQPLPARTLQDAAAGASSATTVQHGPGRQVSAGKFLVANRSLRDPSFAKTVVLLTDYGDNGAMGLIINRATTVRLAEVLPEAEELQDRPDTIYIGGPVARNGMILLIRTEEAPKNTRRVLDGLYLSTSRTVLETMISEGDSESFRVYSGHSGWGPGQLEDEIAQGAWHIVPADTRTVFDPELGEVWQRLIDRTQMRFAWAAHRPLAKRRPKWRER